MHEAIGTNGTAEAVHEAERDTNVTVTVRLGEPSNPDAIDEVKQLLGLEHLDGPLADQARAIIVAATGRKDQAEAAAKTARKARDDAEKGRKDCAQAERDEDTRHREAKADIAEAKKKAAKTARKHADRAKEQAAVAVQMTGIINRYTAVQRVLEAAKPPRGMKL